VPIPALIGPSQRCACNAFHYDAFGDHFHTCQVKSSVSQVHDWVGYRLGDILGSVGHKVKIHKITPTTGKERGDLEIKDYVVLQKPQDQVDRLPPPRTLILDGKTVLLTGLLTGIQGWKCPVALSQTCYGSLSLKVILMDSNFGGHPVLKPLVTQ
jgi:hypothetical protein